MQKTVLVTGGAGFIGSHLVDALLAEGTWRVVVVDSFDAFYDPAIKRANVARHLPHASYALREADIRDEAACRAVFEEFRPDCVVHLAALAGVRPSIASPARYADVNVNGTTVLLSLAREFAVPQFVFGSSSSVYGQNAKVPFSEADPVPGPISPYAATKGAGELMCHAFAHLYPMRCVCLRFFTVYGPGQRPDLAIHAFARLMLDGKPIPLFGDGSTRRDYTYVADIVSGIRAAMAYDGAPYEIFNLGGSRTVELRELVALLEKALGVTAVIDRKPLQPGDVPITSADIGKAGRLLGFDPQTPIEEGIGKFADWILARR